MVEPGREEPAKEKCAWNRALWMGWGDRASPGTRSVSEPRVQERGAAAFLEGVTRAGQRHGACWDPEHSLSAGHGLRKQADLTL